MIEFKDCKVVDGGLLIPKEELLRLKEKWERYEKQYRNVAFDTLCLDIETKSVESFEQELDKVSYFCARSNTKTINAMLENFTQN